MTPPTQRLMLYAVSIAERDEVGRFWIEKTCQIGKRRLKSYVFLSAFFVILSAHNVILSAAKNLSRPSGDYARRPLGLVRK